MIFAEIDEVSSSPPLAHQQIAAVVVSRRVRTNARVRLYSCAFQLTLLLVWCHID